MGIAKGTKMERDNNINKPDLKKEKPSQKNKHVKSQQLPIKSKWVLTILTFQMEWSNKGIHIEQNIYTPSQ